MNKIFEYQALDGQLRKIERELNDSDERKKMRYFQQYLKDAEDNLGKMDKRAVELNVLLSNLTQTYSELTKVISEYADMVAKVESVEELNYLNRKSHEVLTKLNIIDREIKTLVGEMDEISKNYDKYSKDVPQASSQLGQFKIKFNTLVEGRKDEATPIKEKLVELEKLVEPSLIERYSKLKKQGVYPPVVILTAENQCSGCRMEIPSGQISILHENGQLECENCHRIIFLQDK